MRVGEAQFQWRTRMREEQVRCKCLYVVGQQVNSQLREKRSRRHRMEMHRRPFPPRASAFRVSLGVENARPRLFCPFAHRRILWRLSKVSSASPLNVTFGYGEPPPRNTHEMNKDYDAPPDLVQRARMLFQKHVHVGHRSEVLRRNVPRCAATACCEQ